MSLSFAGEIEFAISFFRASRMSFYGLRLKYALDGSSNCISWNEMIEVVLEANGLKEFIDKDIPKLVDTQDLAKWRKCVEKARRIILEGVRDYIVSYLHSKETPYAKWKALKNLFQNNNDHRKLALKEKIKKIM